MDFAFGLSVGDREARANCQCGELIDRVAAGAPVRKLLFIKALGHTRLPFADPAAAAGDPAAAPCASAVNRGELGKVMFEYEPELFSFRRAAIST